MARRWMRVTVVVGTLTVLSFLAHQIRLAELTLDGEQNVERAFTDLSWTLTLTLADLRAAGQAYVAEGQDRLYWTSKVTEHLATVADSLDNLRRLAISPTSIEALDAVSATMAELETIDRRAREHTSLDQLLLASDLLFTDGQELAARAASQVDLARSAERTLRNETVRQTRTTQTQLLLGGVGISVLAMLLLVPGLRRSGAAPFSDEAQEEPSIETSGETAPLSSEDRLTLEDLDLGAAQADETEAPSAASAGAMPDLRLAADLCTDLGRLADPGDLAGLLARSADLMNASGLIIWVRDPRTATLRPALGHGYPTRTLAAMGAIPEDGDNATAAAYRAGQMQVVEGSEGGSGALAAPLLASEQCVGVLSAELHDGWEASPAVQATVAILAAQLTTLVAPTADNDEVSPAEAHG
tara:strand:+ start:2468 stop:3709 length:1242 start_codon:yes stop_codon:yes gene_type:complete